ncbi:MAG: Nif3-like dinuclear metal center hexameric protein [Clostridia bacterium]|nr:Nif3-like dinuclear metal center hexameric protein [Clostridia bacterium]
MKLQEIIDKIESFAPLAMACEGDNPGLMFGKRDKEINRVLVALDVDMGVIREAAEKGADLIVTHHPLMFDPIRQINEETPAGRCLLELAENGIALYSAHTNLDSAKGGLNDIFADKLGISGTKPIEITYTDENGTDYGIGRVGAIEKETTLADFATFVCKCFDLPSTNFVGDGNAKVKTVAVCSGSGADMISKKLAAEADVYVTGDVKYSGARKFASLDLNLITAGHYETEICAMEVFKEILSGCPLEIICSKANKNVFNYTEG